MMFDFARLRAPAPPPGPRPLAHFEAALRQRLKGRLVHLTITQNRRTVISYRREAAGFRVRLHSVFLEGDDRVIDALGRFIARPDTTSRRDIDSFLTERLPRHSPRRRGRSVLPVGDAYDLEEILDELNTAYFAGRLQVRITWGRCSTVRRVRRSIRLGTWSEEHRLITLHPALDSREVPRYVVEAVVYHEMLHAALPVIKIRGRRELHSPEFRRLERQFEHHRRAEEWLARHLDKLLVHGLVRRRAPRAQQRKSKR